MSILNLLKMLGDPTRVRLLHMLSKEPLSVADLQEILGMGQSRISSQLSQLAAGGLVRMSKSGKHSIYEWDSERVTEWDLDVVSLVRKAAAELPETEEDLKELGYLLTSRKDAMKSYFDELAGRFGKEYVPGRSWKAVAEALVKLLPPLIIADLGAGEGTLSQWLAKQASKVYAIDNSERMVSHGRDLARDHGLDNVEFVLGDLEQVPLGDESIDLVLLSQALHHALRPERALGEAFRILKPGGRLLILDLNRHRFEEARELYADVWLGFGRGELESYLLNEGFGEVEILVADQEASEPGFETLLAYAERPVGVITAEAPQKVSLKT